MPVKVQIKNKMCEQKNGKEALEKPPLTRIKGIYFIFIRSPRVLAYHAVFHEE